jgi:hypothetical protein
LTSQVFAAIKGLLAFRVAQTLNLHPKALHSWTLRVHSWFYPWALSHAALGFTAIVRPVVLPLVGARPVNPSATNPTFPASPRRLVIHKYGDCAERFVVTVLLAETKYAWAEKVAS